MTGVGPDLTRRRFLLGSLSLLPFGCDVGSEYSSPPLKPVVRKRSEPPLEGILSEDDDVIRVSIFETVVPATGFRVLHGCTPVRPSDGKVLAEHKLLGDARVRLERTADGFTVRSGNQQWTHRGKELDFPCGDESGFWFGSFRFRGTVRVIHEGDRTRLVNFVRMRDYLASVVDSEMPLTFGMAAREAQIIAARSYARFHMRRKHPRFDVFASTRSQKYLGWQYKSNGRLLAGETKQGIALARQTAGLVLTTNRRLLCAYYSACCGGQTVAGAEVFGDSAASIPSVTCLFCEPSPQYRWTRTATRDAVGKALGVGPDFRIMTDKEGRVLLTMGGRTTELDRKRIQERVFGGDLPSSRFDATSDANKITLRGRGHGHGVGLCQWGAKGQADAGRTGRQILNHYYPDSELVLASGVPQA